MIIEPLAFNDTDELLRFGGNATKTLFFYVPIIFDITFAVLKHHQR